VNAPSQLFKRAVVYDAVNHNMMTFGGADDPWDAWQTTQILRYRANATPEACTSAAIDYDNDGKAGCADDECWSVCDPLTPPGTTRPANAPFCGDGYCNYPTGVGVENCSICPQDCGPCTGVCGDFHCDVGETPANCPNDC
jgi:hypothetical protein